MQGELLFLPTLISLCPRIQKNYDCQELATPNIVRDQNLPPVQKRARIAVHPVQPRSENMDTKSKINYVVESLA